MCWCFIHYYTLLLSAHVKQYKYVSVYFNLLKMKSHYVFPARVCVWVNDLKMTLISKVETRRHEAMQQQN